MKNFWKDSNEHELRRLIKQHINKTSQKVSQDKVLEVIDSHNFLADIFIKSMIANGIAGGTAKRVSVVLTSMTDVRKQSNPYGREYTSCRNTFGAPEYTT